MWDKWCVYSHIYIYMDYHERFWWWLELNTIYSVMKNISKRHDFYYTFDPLYNWLKSDSEFSFIFTLFSPLLWARLTLERRASANRIVATRETCRGNGGARVQRDARHRIMPERTRRPGARGATGITRSFVTSHLHTSRGVSCASV